MPFSVCKGGIDYCLREGIKAVKRFIFPNRSYGVAITQEPFYQYPEGHPCYGCTFVFKSSKPSCMTGSYPDTKNCINAFYKKITAQRRTEQQSQIEKGV